MVANQIRPPSFPPIQNNQNRFNPNQGNNFNQNRGTNFNQNRNFNQGQVYQPSTIQTPVYQAPTQQMQGVSKTNFENYVKANDAVDGLKDALVEMPKFNKWLSSLLRNKEKLEEIAITTVNAECSAIIMNKVPEKLEDPGKFSYPITWCLEAFEAHPNDHSSLLTVSLRTPIAMEVSSNFEEGYFDLEGDVIFLENLLSDDTTHNLAPEVISDHEPEQNESSITFSPRSDPLHHEFAGEIITLPSRNDREFEEYLSLMTVLCEISTSRSQENVHANQSSIIESLPLSPIPVEDSDPVQEEIDIFLVPDDLIPPGVEK
ncbi:hypothetical protein Tco_0434787 [Tanacetum coccineum]